VSFVATGTFLVASSLRNGLAAQLRRLRRPRYLVPAALALLYGWWVLRANPLEPVRRLFPNLTWQADRVEVGAAALFLLPVLMSWLFGRPRPRLIFSEPEILFLFAAPVPRRSVVHFALVKVLLGSAVVALLPTALLARSLQGSAAATAAAFFVVVATLNLHQVGASFARAWVWERFGLVRLRALQLGGLALVGVLLWLDGGRVLLTTVLWPARLLVRPALAEGAGPFLVALLPAMAILALHYLWVVLAADRFEDASLELAERAARRLEALRAGGQAALTATRRPRSRPFRLPRRAWPELALAWKGLIGMSRSLTLRLLLGTLAAIVVLLATLLVTSTGGGPRASDALGILSAVFLGFVLILGPAMVGGGLAADLGRLDLLRTLPLPGYRIVLGQALAPAAALSAAWLCLVPAVAVLLPAPLGGLERAFLGLALAMAGPPTLLLGVLLQAALTAVMPGWAGQEPGPLAIGRMLMQQFVQLVGFPILAIPPALVAAVFIALGYRLAGWGVVPVAALAGASMVAAEIALGLGLIGKAFEAIDPADL
jgi:hypothetical protein